MNGLPEEIDVSFFYQRRLEQLCLGEYQIQLRFDRDVEVAVEGEYTLDGQRCTVGEGHLLHHLIGLSVQSASRNSMGDLRLDFSEHVLLLHDSNLNYESYTIRSNNDVIIV